MSPAENKSQYHSNLITILGTVISIHYMVINLRVFQLFSLTLHALQLLWESFYSCGLSNTFCSQRNTSSDPSGGSGTARTMSEQYVSVKRQTSEHVLILHSQRSYQWPRHYRMHSCTEVYAKEPFCYITNPMVSVDLSWSGNIMLLKKHMEWNGICWLKSSEKKKKADKWETEKWKWVQNESFISLELLMGWREGWSLYRHILEWKACDIYLELFHKLNWSDWSLCILCKRKKDTCRIHFQNTIRYLKKKNLSFLFIQQWRFEGLKMLMLKIRLQNSCFWKWCHDLEAIKIRFCENLDIQHFNIFFFFYLHEQESLWQCCHLYAYWTTSKMQRKIV